MSTHFPNRRWLIIPAELAESVNFNEVHETSLETLRYSIDGTKTFIKYEVSIIEEDQVTAYINAETGEEKTHTIQAGVYGRPAIWTEESVEYTHPEILAILATEEWSTPISIDPPQ
jgi:hypothetical protein